MSLQNTNPVFSLHLPLRFMGRTLTATFTFVSDIFVHFSLPPCLCAELSMYSLRISDKKPGFVSESKALVKQPEKSPDLEEKSWEYVHFLSFISIRVRLLCKSSTLLQLQTASPPPSSTGSTTAILWQTGDGCAKEGERNYAPRRLWGGNNSGGEMRGCLTS